MNEVYDKAKQAQAIAPNLANLPTEQKNKALQVMARILRSEQDYLLSENKKDIEAAKMNEISDTMIDRLTLTKDRISEMANALEQVATLDDPIGDVLESSERPNGLHLKNIRVPLGVVAMIYEARPNVTVDAASLCLKTGNAVLLRGSSTAIHSNIALVDVLQAALKEVSISIEAIQLIEDTSRQTAEHLFTCREYIDVLLIPRGGARLIQAVVEKARVPVIETGVGNCHIYIDDSAKVELAKNIVVNAKTQRPSVCNAAETIIIHEAWAEDHFNSLVDVLDHYGVTFYGDEKACIMDSRVNIATEIDWTDEYLDLKVAITIVPSLDKAINHIRQYGTKHSEAIISETDLNVKIFQQLVDAAAIYHHASTRFTDGFEFGFGAEIGISTQKLHARGPMGLHALTSNKYLIKGNGQIKG
ncbi:glutamate-5-semialdehyde dehydrogenase [Bacillus sp. FJAT-45037]|uniref:glutamate-5-semialdehyde dehydrogenase n=1 Tax=Bacillus sp. FJAT-45037 TaxID=2011007 RepID=UPI0012FE6E41|nr:glutamate-5-semialdehyde dehydrogenase [Bacillus sp. FJAT-45037]